MDAGQTLTLVKYFINLMLKQNACTIMRHKRIVHCHKMDMWGFAGERADISMERNPHIAGHGFQFCNKFISCTPLARAGKEHFLSERIIH